MATYLEDLVQNIYTNCDMKGLNDLNDGLQKAVGYTKELDDRLRSAHQAQKQGFDFHARAINASKEAYQVESQRLKLVDQDTRMRMRRADLEDKYAHNARRRDVAELARMHKRNRLIQYGIRLLGAYVSIRTLQNIIQTGSRLQLVQKSIEGLTKSTQDWGFVEQQAFKMGVSLETVAKGYRNFYSAANMAGFGKGDIQGMYADLLLATRSIGASTQQTEGALLALEQMISKGKVSMEELRRQLGNAIPGAFEIGAKAMNMTTAQFNDFVKTGKLASAEFVPKFIKTLKETYAGGWQDIEQTVSVAQGRLKVAWEKFTINFMSGEAGKAFAQGLNSLAELLNSNEFKELVQILGVIFKWTMEIFKVLVKIFKFLLAVLPYTLTLLGVGGLYGLLQKFPLILELISLRTKEAATMMIWFGKEGIKSFFAMNKAALAFGVRIMGILSWVLILQDVLLYIASLLTGTQIDTMTGAMVEDLPKLGDIVKNMFNLGKDSLNKSDLNRVSDKNLRQKIRLARINGDVARENRLWEEARSKGVITGGASSIQGNFTPYSTPEIIPNGLPIGGTTPYGGTLNKEQEVSTSVNIGDINVYSNASNPQQVAQEVQEQLIALFMGQGLTTNVEGFA